MAASDMNAHDDHEWGLCKNCEYWQVEPKAQVADATLGHCVHEELEHFNLRVSGQSGCNHYAPGQPKREEGASAAPPHVASAH
jgi:hypothetical protein